MQRHHVVLHPHYDAKSSPNTHTYTAPSWPSACRHTATNGSSTAPLQTFSRSVHILGDQVRVETIRSPRLTLGFFLDRRPIAIRVGVVSGLHVALGANVEIPVCASVLHLKTRAALGARLPYAPVAGWVAVRSHSQGSVAAVPRHVLGGVGLEFLQVRLRFKIERCG